MTYYSREQEYDYKLGNVHELSFLTCKQMSTVINIDLKSYYLSQPKLLMLYSYVQSSLIF